VDSSPLLTYRKIDCNNPGPFFIRLRFFIKTVLYFRVLIKKINKLHKDQGSLDVKCLKTRKNGYFARSAEVMYIVLDLYRQEERAVNFGSDAINAQKAGTEKIHDER